jgi:hypothetical protein
MQAQLVQQLAFGRGRIEQVRDGRMINESRERTKPAQRRPGPRGELVEGGAFVGKFGREGFVLGLVLKRFRITDAFGFEQAALILECVLALFRFDPLQAFLLRVVEGFGDPGFARGENGFDGGLACGGGGIRFFGLGSPACLFGGQGLFVLGAQPGGAQSGVLFQFAAAGDAIAHAAPQAVEQFHRGGNGARVIRNRCGVW